MARNRSVAMRRTLAAAGRVAVQLSLSPAGADDDLPPPRFTNFITGTDNADVLNGGAGRDFISGRRGADVIYGRDGTDEAKVGQATTSSSLEQVRSGPGRHGRSNDDYALAVAVTTAFTGGRARTAWVAAMATIGCTAGLAVTAVGRLFRVGRVQMSSSVSPAARQSERSTCTATQGRTGSSAAATARDVDRGLGADYVRLGGGDDDVQQVFPTARPMSSAAVSVTTRCFTTALTRQTGSSAVSTFGTSRRTPSAQPSA